VPGSAFGLARLLARAGFALIGVFAPGRPLARLGGALGRIALCATGAARLIVALVLAGSAARLTYLVGLLAYRLVGEARSLALCARRRRLGGGVRRLSAARRRLVGRSLGGGGRFASARRLSAGRFALRRRLPAAGLRLGSSPRLRSTGFGVTGLGVTGLGIAGFGVTGFGVTGFGVTRFGVTGFGVARGGLRLTRRRGVTAGLGRGRTAGFPRLCLRSARLPRFAPLRLGPTGLIGLLLIEVLHDAVKSAGVVVACRRDGGGPTACLSRGAWLRRACCAAVGRSGA
jgi:hypothetical protein